MKALKNIAVAFTLLMVIAIVIFFNLGRKYSYTNRDIVFYNDLLFRIEEDYLAGVPEETIEERYGCSVVLSKKLDDPELAQLYSSYALVLDLAPEGEYIGKVAWVDELDRFEASRKAFLKNALFLWSCVLAGGYLLLLVIYVFFVRPTRELSDFAGEIAKGNLDIELPMHRINLFGSFTEAFDLMREELKTARKKEIDAEIARKELVTSLSHDIKTPLAVIKASCEVLDMKLQRIGDDPSGSTGAEARDAADKIAVISGKADTIGRLMTEMMHANQEEFENIEVRAEEENSAVIEDFIRKLQGYGRIEVENDIPPCLVYIDRFRMEQVIDNVIGNSHKYAGTGVKVRFDLVEQVLMGDGTEGSFIRIRISDSGPGVSEDDLPLIAEKYYRGSNAAKDNGYGLGLYLVRCYMAGMGGGMEYYNDNGFVVELMVRKV